MSQPGFFDLDERYSALSKQGDPLGVLGTSIPWPTCRPVLKKIRNKQRNGSAGRKPYGSILMFKILVLQSLYKLSDEQTGYPIRDRLSLLRLPGLTLEDHVPNATTLWLFREALARQRLIERLFEQFNGHLERHGYQARKGQIVDASMVPAPKAATAARRAPRSNVARFRPSGRRNRTNAASRTPMRAGPRSTARTITATRTTSLWTIATR